MAQTQARKLVALGFLLLCATGFGGPVKAQRTDPWLAIPAENAMRQRHSLGDKHFAMPILPERELRAFWEVEAGLESRVQLDVVNEPLSKVLTRLSEQTSPVLRFHVDSAALELNGIEANTAVTLRNWEADAGQTLRAVLRPFGGSDFYIQGGVIWISTPEALGEASMLCFAYPVRHLTKGNAGDLEDLKGLIMETCSPETWPDQSGPAPIPSWQDVLLIRQTYEVHRQIEAFLRGLYVAHQQQISPPSRSTP